MEDHRLDSLGRLEDLPTSYREALQRQNLVPLWPSLRAMLPPRIPSRNTRATHWPYAGLRPLLMQAGDLTPIEKAERRVLVLANPGHGRPPTGTRPTRCAWWSRDGAPAPWWTASSARWNAET